MHSGNHDTNAAPANQTAGITGKGLGTKTRGAAEVIHGAADEFRGTLLGAADTAIGRSSGVEKNDEIAHKGRQELERGLAKVRGNVASQGGPGQQGTIPAPAETGTLGSAGYDAPHGPNAGYPPRQPGAGQGVPQDPQGTGQVFPDQYGPPAAGQHQHQHHPHHQHGAGPGQGPHAGPGVGAGNQVPSDQVGGQIPPVFPANRAQRPSDDAASDQPPSSGPGPQTTHPGHHRDDGISGIPQNQRDDIQTRANEQNEAKNPSVQQYGTTPQEQRDDHLPRDLPNDAQGGAKDANPGPSQDVAAESNPSQGPAPAN